jgi:drug/metabolite transporter (DMT)-like permease
MLLLVRLRDWGLLVLCNMIWASQFAMAKLVQRQMGPIFATFFPMALATLFLIPVVAAERRRSVAMAASRRFSDDIIAFLLLGICGQVAAQLLITWGVRLSPASNAALLSLALPICTAVIAFLILGEHMTFVRWTSFALAIAGVLVCSGINWKELNFTADQFLLGNLLIFASVNGSAFYNVYSKKMLVRYSPLQVLLYSYYVVLLVLAPITICLEPEGFRNLKDYDVTVWIGLLMLAIFQYLISMVVFLTVLTRLDATQAGLCNYLIPFFGLVIAAILLNERLTPFMIAGGLLVLVSTLLVTAYEEKRRTRLSLTRK